MPSMVTIHGRTSNILDDKLVLSVCVCVSVCVCLCEGRKKQKRRKAYLTFHVCQALYSEVSPVFSTGGAGRFEAGVPIDQ